MLTKTCLHLPGYSTFFWLDTADITNSTTGSYWDVRISPHHFLADRLTLFQSGLIDYAHLPT